MSGENQETTGCGGSDCGKGQAMDAKTDKDGQIVASLSRIKHKLLVMSGKGGVGKSSVSAGLAIQLADSGYRVGLLDVDIHGPSLAGIMGVKGLLQVSAERKVTPHEVDAHLKVVSMQSLMKDHDQAIIWRGPAKAGVIRQFLSDVDWGDLDFLIVDAPPGTGDEPLGVAQTVPEAKAVIVTTPQDVALSDVRKSISFCRVIGMTILGLVENMGPFPCPCCGKPLALFKSGGGEATAGQMEVPFLGTLPFDPLVVKACDNGQPRGLRESGAAFSDAMAGIVQKLIGSLSP
ncbi:MAG: Mrp/NBP35 family ATP-binding protein [Desulfobacteraceae bacterium]|jgi:Mrp family chromosome partitioning ATPase